MENDGAAAVVLVSAERARDLKPKPAYLLGVAQGSEHRNAARGAQRARSTRRRASPPWRRTSTRWPASAPRTSTCVQSYENFTGGVLMSLVEHGFFTAEEANDFLTLDNLIAPDGRLPLNTSGGNLAECYMHGLELQIEAVRQLRGESTSQVPGARRVDGDLGSDGDAGVERHLRLARRRSDGRAPTTSRPACPRRSPSPTASTPRTGRARGESELRIQRCRECRTWHWGPEWICHRVPLLRHRMASGWRVAGLIYSWERAWHPVHPALKGHRPVHRGAGGAAGGRRRPHARQPPRRSAPGGDGSARRSRPSSSRTTTRRRPTPSCTGRSHKGVTMSQLEINGPNLWRLETPGHAGWSRTARPGDPNKYFIVSADCHANEPSNLWAERIDAKYRDRLPRVITDANGVQWRVSEGHRPGPAARERPGGRGSRSRQQAGADPGQRLRDHGPRRHRRRGDLPEQGPLDVGHARRGLRPGAVPRLQRVGVGDVRRLQRPAVAGGRHRHRRSRGLHRRGAARGQGGLPRAHPAVQARLGSARHRPSELQPAALRSAVGRHPGHGAAHHVPRLDGPRSARLARQRRRRHQLRLALALADGGAGGQPLRLRRARALPRAALRDDRGRDRLAPVGARRDGRGVPQASLLGATQAQAPAQRVLPPARLRVVPGRPGRARARGALST